MTVIHVLYLFSGQEPRLLFSCEGGYILFSSPTREHEGVITSIIILFRSTTSPPVPVPYYNCCVVFSSFSGYTFYFNDAAADDDG